MSQENIEAVRHWFDAYNRRDLETLVLFTDPDFSFRSRFVALESEFRAYEGFPHAYFQLLDDAYDRFHIAPHEFVDVGAGVLTSATAEWRGKASGAEGTLPIFPAFWLKAGRVVHATTYTDLREARDALGLPQQDAHADS